MSNTNEYGSCLIYEGTLDAGCPLDMLADLCRIRLEQSKEEVCKQVAQQFSQGRSFTLVHRESLGLDPLPGWRSNGEDDFGRFAHFTPINRRNMYLQCNVGRATSQGTTYIIHVFDSNWTEPIDDPCLLKIMIELEVPPVTRELILFRSRMHAGLWAIYDKHGPGDAESCLSDLLKDAAALVDIAGQRVFQPGDERIFGQLRRAFRFKGDVELLKGLRGKFTSFESRSFFRTAVFSAMEENLKDMERLYHGK